MKPTVFSLLPKVEFVSGASIEKGKFLRKQGIITAIKYDLQQYEESKVPKRPHKAMIGEGGLRRTGLG